MGRRSGPLVPGLLASGSRLSATSRLASLAPAALSGAKSRRLERLREAGGDGLRLRLPDVRLQEAFQAVKNHIHVFDDGDHFSPGTFLYHNHWFRDSAYIALAFENMGWSDRVTPKLLAYGKSQTADGFFKSQNGEWDSNGEAMWTLVNHVRRGADLSLLERFYPSLLKGARWIARMRDSTRTVPSPHYGLLPPGFSAEHFGPNDHYYWDNLWSLAGLEAAKWAADRMGTRKEATFLSDLILDYRGDLAASMDWAYKKSGCHALPCSPYRSLDSAAIGNLVAFSPLGLLGPEEPWLRGTLDYLLDNNLREGLFFQKIVHTGLNPYLSVQLARALMVAGDPRWQTILEALLRRASPTFAWPEALHPRVFGGCMGDGDHGWSAAEFLNLVREMLVTEVGGSLKLCEGAPAGWFRPGRDLEVTGASTLHGTLDFSLRQGPASATLTWNLKRAPHQDPVPLWFRLPWAAGLVPGASETPDGETYRIPLPGESGVLTFPRTGTSDETRPGADFELQPVPADPRGHPLHKRSEEATKASEQ